jgi:hypothetical protein
VSIAITQNFIPCAHLASALRFLRDRPEQVSGFSSSVKDPYNEFTQQLRKLHPYELSEALTEMTPHQNHRKRKWDDLVQGKNCEKPFSFGFAEMSDSDDDVP